MDTTKPTPRRASRASTRRPPPALSTGGQRCIETPNRQAPFGSGSGEVVMVYGDDTCPNTRLFPEPAAATCTSAQAWTPRRLRDPDELAIEDAAAGRTDETDDSATVTELAAVELTQEDSAELVAVAA